MFCPYCSAELSYAERAVRFEDEDSGYECVVNLECSFCPACGEWTKVKKA